MNCPFCNFELPDGALFCGSCGKKLTDVQEQPADVSEVAEVAETPVEVTAEQTAVETAETVAEETPVEEAPVAESTLSSTFAPSGDAVAVAAPTVATEAATAVEEVAEEVAETVQSVPTESAAAPAEAVAAVANTVETVEEKKSEGVDIGAAVQEDVQQASEAIKNKDFNALFKNKTFLVAVALIVVAILIIFIAAVSAAVSGGGSKYETKGSYYYVESDDEGIFFYNGKKVTGAEFSDTCDRIAYSPDGSVVLVEDDTDLYILKNGKATLITDDFDTSKATISSNGKTVAYVSDDSVFVYTGGKPKQIAELEDDRMCTPILSPDGKIVAFADYDDDDVKTYAWKGSKVIDLDSDIIPFAVSNGGKYIYGLTRDQDLTYIKGLKANADEKIDSASSVVGIDYDHTKLLYVSEGKTYCFDPSLSKEDGVKVDNDVVYPYTLDYYMSYIPYVENFKSFYGATNDNIYEFFRKGKEYNDEKLLSDVDDFEISEDFKSFVYIDEDGNLMKGTLSNAKNEKEVDKDVISIRVNDTLKSVFYLDDDRNLRYVGKDDKIGSDVERYVVTDGGVCVFNDEDDDLYYSVKGGEKKDAGLSDVTAIRISNNVVYVIADSELYISTNGKSFTATGIEID